VRQINEQRRQWELQKPQKTAKNYLLLLGSRTLGCDDLSCEWYALSATRLAAEAAIGAGGAGRAVPRGLPKVRLSNRVADTNDHGTRHSANATNSQYGADTVIPAKAGIPLLLIDAEKKELDSRFCGDEAQAPCNSLPISFGKKAS
jgi:hypothetical protein